MSDAGSLDAHVRAVRTRASKRHTSSVCGRCGEQPHLWVGVPVPLGHTEGRVFFDILIFPLVPTIAAKSGEEFQIWPGRTLLDNVVDPIGLSRMLSFLTHDDVCLTPAGCKCSHVAASADLSMSRTTFRKNMSAVVLDVTCFQCVPRLNEEATWFDCVRYMTHL